MNAVGIDVSKGKSMVAIMRLGGEVVESPFEVVHTEKEFAALADRLKQLPGETKVIMEYTGIYYQTIAYALYDYGLTISAVHPKLVHGFDNNSIRKIKTDKADAVKIANYGLFCWAKLPEWTPEDDLRRLLKAYSRQYSKYGKIRTMLKNNLISLMDQTFPDINALFASKPRADGHQKWVDFAMQFWHCECVCGITPGAFEERYRKWCGKSGYRFSKEKAENIYLAACEHYNVLPKSKSTKTLIHQTIMQFNAIAETMARLAMEMKRLAEELPEYPVVIEFFGVGGVLGPQLMAEIGDVERFHKKGSLVCFAGLEAPPFQSGKFESKDRSVSKKGSPHLRKTLFQVMDCILKNAPADDPVYQFLDRKRAEGKHYYSYMTAGSAKFLRIYYARVKAYLNKLNTEAEVLPCQG